RPKAMPTGSAPPLHGRVSSSTPSTAVPIHTVSLRRRIATTATTSGPRNSSAVAVPSGIRAVASEKKAIIPALTVPRITTAPRSRQPARRTAVHSDGPDSTIRISAANVSRSQVAPSAPTSSNRCTVNALPVCRENMPTRTSRGAGTRGPCTRTWERKEVNTRPLDLSRLFLSTDHGRTDRVLLRHGSDAPAAADGAGAAGHHGRRRRGGGHGHLCGLQALRGLGEGGRGAAAGARRAPAGRVRGGHPRPGGGRARRAVRARRAGGPGGPGHLRQPALPRGAPGPGPARRRASRGRRPDHRERAGRGAGAAAERRRRP